MVEIGRCAKGSFCKCPAPGCELLPYDLSEDLAAKIRQTFLDFKPKETTLAKRFEDSQAVRFVPVSYKQDFAIIRRIDSMFQKPPGE